MKKRLLSLLCVVSLLLGLCAVPAAATDADITLGLTVTATQSDGSTPRELNDLRSGDLVTAVITLDALSASAQATGFANATVGLNFDTAKFDCTSVIGLDTYFAGFSSTTSSKDESNTNGYAQTVGFALSNQSLAEDLTLLTAVFSVKSETTGSVTFGLREIADPTSPEFSDSEGNDYSIAIPAPVSAAVVEPMDSLTVNALSIVKGGTPTTSVTGNGYTGSVSWSGTMVDSKFGYDTYPGTVTLIPAEGKVFTDTASVTYGGTVLTAAEQTVNGCKAKLVSQHTTQIVFTVSSTISQSIPTISVTPDQSVVYDRNPVTAGKDTAGDIHYTYNGDGAVTVSWYDTDANGNQSAKRDDAPTNAGVYFIGVKATAGTDYGAAAEITQKFTITQAANAAITIAAGQSVTYDTSPVTAGKDGAGDIHYAYTGDGAVAVNWYADESNAKGNALNTAPSAVGTYWIGVSAVAGTNYAAVAEVAQQFTITRATNASITIAAGQSATFDGSAVTAGKDNAGDIHYAYTGDGAVTVTWYTDSSSVKGNPISAPSAAGTYWIGVSAAAGNNYDVVTEVAQKFTIQQTLPTIAIDADQSVTYDGSAVTTGKDDAGDIHYTYNGDGAVNVNWYADSNGVKGNPISAPSAAGTYWIGVSAAAGTNYAAGGEITRKFTIGKATLTPGTFSGTVTKVFNGDIDAGNLTGGVAIASGICGSDNVSITAVPGSYADKNAGIGKTVTLTLGLTGSAAGNYQLSQSTQIFTGAAITQAAAPTVTGSTYVLSNQAGNDNATYTYSLSGLTGIPANAGTIYYSNPTVTAGGTMVTNATVTSGVLTLTVTPQAAGTTATITVQVASTNYATAAATITVTSQNKQPATVAVRQSGTTYGTALSAPVVSAKNGDNAVLTGGEWTYQYNGTTDGGEGYSSTKAPAQAGTYTVTAVYEDATYYGTAASENFIIAPKAITAAVNAASREYGAGNPSFDFTVPTLAYSDTKADLGVSLSCTADASSVPGSYDVTGSATNPNYTVTISGASKLTVTKAALTLTGSPVSLGTVLANDSRNTTAAALLSAVQTATPSLTATYANGSTTLNAVWSLTSGSWNARGGSYTYTAALTPADAAKFSYAGAVTLDVSVTPVTALLSLSAASATRTEAELDKASDNAALGLPAAVTVSYDHGVAATTYSITGWNQTLDQLQSLTAPQTVTLTPAFTAPDWATVGTAPTFALTISNKYPVAIRFTTAIEDITYGDTLRTPAATQDAISNGTDTSATYTYLYTGATASGTAYSSANAPTQAGSYQVTATLISDTHTGSGSDEFKISPKTAVLSWIGYTARDFDNTNSAVTATVTNPEPGDTCTVTVTGGTQKDAGNHNAVATALSNSNYILPTSKSQSYTIRQVDRNLRISPANLLLIPGTLTGTITTVYENLDSSAALRFTSGDTTLVTVSNSGAVTAVGTSATPVSVTVSIPATTNYTAASQTCEVTAVKTPLTGATASSNVNTDQLTAVISGSTIIVSGTVTDGAIISVAPVAVSGITASAVTSGTVGVDGWSNTIPLNVTLSAASIASYTVNFSGVTVVPANTKVEETAPDTNITALPEAVRDTIQTVLSNAATKTQGLVAAAAEKLVSVAQNLLSQIPSTIANPTLEVKVGVNMAAKSYTEGASLKLDLTPTFTATAVDGNDSQNTVALVSDQPLSNADITAPVQVSVQLPASLQGNTLVAKHTLENGAVEYLKVTCIGTVASWLQSSFSEVELLVNNHSGSISYTYENGTVQTVAYTAANLTDSLAPADSRTGSTFNGWDVTVDGQTYTKQMTLSADLLAKINGKTATAVASFTQNATTPTTPVGGGGAGITAKTWVITPSAGANGSISPAKETTVTAGESQIFTMTPAAGYRVADVLVDGVSVGAVSSYTFTNVAAAHTISVTFVKGTDVTTVFRDITAETWCHDAVQYVYDNGLMNGTATDLFSAGRTLNRGMLATILYRLAGSPAVSATSPFSDVTDSTWCRDAVIWASGSGVVNGFADKTFRANAPITRQQFVSMLYRYAKLQGYDVSASKVLSGYTDAADAWDAAAMQWALANGIVDGTTSTTLSPNANANRGQAATFLMRFQKAMG